VNLSTVLEMAAAGFPDREAVQAPGGTADFARLAALARAAAARLSPHGPSAVVYIGPNHLAFPVCLFGAAAAGIPFVPLNYRLAGERLQDLVARHPRALVVHGGRHRLGGALRPEEFLADVDPADAGDSPMPDDPELCALVLYTSGTTGAPKAAVLRHRHLTSYLLGSVEFGSAGAEEKALVAVPPYHVAGVANLLSNVYACRPIVYLDQFDPKAWLETVRRASVTQAMVVPTMLARIVEELEGSSHAEVPSLRVLSYGGSRMPLSVLERALALFPEVGFVNAYGLTETSSTVALLGPDDHRLAASSDLPEVRARLGSVGKPLPGVEVEIRGDEGEVLAPGEPGCIFLRGPQISGEYADGAHGRDGWFATRDRGWVDEDGYLFIEGRADDTIIRGGENVAPAEIEEVLTAHPSVLDAGVVGVPDQVWGQRIVAGVVLRPGEEVDPESLRDWVRQHLRSSRTPDQVLFVDEMPRTDTGKLLRRQLLRELTAPPPLSKTSSSCPGDG
jgi:acyl-CoA synthetase (AMP-forming)/AMP-acid ligase II